MMALSYIPLLGTQLEIYNVPLGLERFKSYIKTILGSLEDDTELAPLAHMNPMAKDHAKVYLENLIAIEADATAQTAVTDFKSRFNRLNDLDIKVSLVVCDDAKGGWTNRYLNEFTYFFDFDKRDFLKRPWLMVPCWTGDEVSGERIYKDTLAYLYRLAYVFEHHQAKTLRQMLEQEGQVLAFAGIAQGLDADEFEYSRAVIEAYLESTAKPVQLACLYGDEAAKSVGYEPFGLAHRAGFGLALAQALGRERVQK
jgi:hypothetical protein